MRETSGKLPTAIHDNVKIPEKRLNMAKKAENLALPICFCCESLNEVVIEGIGKLAPLQFFSKCQVSTDNEQFICPVTHVQSASNVLELWQLFASDDQELQADHAIKAPLGKLRNVVDLSGRHCLA